jgi:hypothetical protein
MHVQSMPITTGKVYSIQYYVIKFVSDLRFPFNCRLSVLVVVALSEDLLGDVIKSIKSVFVVVCELLTFCVIDEAPEELF